MRDSFRLALLKAVQESDLKAFQKAVIRIRTLNPVPINELRMYSLNAAYEANVIDQAEFQAAMQDVKEIDWNKLVDFLMKILPLIIELIGMF